jgi:hypothetical protein
MAGSGYGAVPPSEEIKVYPVSLLVRHEVVNDVVAGRPIFAAYWGENGPRWGQSANIQE